MAELEKSYKKLQEQGHTDRKELAKLREELQVEKAKVQLGQTTKQHHHCVMCVQTLPQSSKSSDDQFEDVVCRLPCPNPAPVMS